jgi:hypothetical protein
MTFLPLKSWNRHTSNELWIAIMSEDLHIDGQNGGGEFEREDLAPKPILLFLLGLIVACVLVALVLRGLYGFMDAYESQHQPALNPLAQQTTADTRVVTPGDITKFPQPRLETNEPMEINAFRLQEEQTLNSYDWVDRPAGVVRIPIDRAMELLAQRGLPTRPQTVPDGSMGKPAAQRPDTSGQPAKRK